MTTALPNPFRRPASRRRAGPLVAVAAALMFAASLAQATPLEAQLLVNGDAEAGSTSGWISTGVDAVSSAIPGTAGLPAGASIGAFSFTGGTGSAASQTLSQTVALGDLAALVDAQQLTVHFSALLQSRRDADTVDTARATLRFLDGGGATISSLAFVDASVPLNVKDWSFASAAQAVPGGTRALQVLLDISRQGGTSSDGFVDNLQLSVSAVPEPSGLALMAAGLLALARARPSWPWRPAQPASRASTTA